MKKPTHILMFGMAAMVLCRPSAAQRPFDFDHVRAQVKVAAADSSRPRFHFVPPAKEMIDVWGGMRFRDAYRLFYDLNLTAERRMGGSFMQLETRDFIRWTHLPPAQHPDCAAGELRLNDGCVLIRDDGTPIMYLTRVFADGRDREHVALVGDRDMVTFRRLGREGAVTLENHGGPRYWGGWSDVFFFQEAGRRFMVISKCVRADNGKAEIPIYEAEDASCLKWRYRGTFFEDNGEVVNFTQVDGKWVLIYCPYGNPVYHVGDFDVQTAKFTSRKKDVLSYGYSCQGDEHNLMSRGFYATSVFACPAGSRVITAWISGFLNPRGWDGCIAIPRELSLGEDLTVKMLPVDELKAYRRNARKVTNGMFDITGSLDLELEFKGSLDIRVGHSIVIGIGRRVVNVNETAMPVKDPRRLRLLVDVSTVELFLDDGRWNLTRAVPMVRPDDRLEISGDAVGTLYDMPPVEVADPYGVFAVDR